MIWLSELSRQLNGRSSFDLACMCALLFAVGFGSDSWLTLMVGIIVLTAICWKPTWIQHPALWLLLSIAWGTQVALHWFDSDNHRFLFVYLCLALFLHAGHPKREQLFALTARLLISAVFCIAVIQKLSNAEFRSGAYMEITLLVDKRVVPLLKQVLGLDQATTQVNLERMKSVIDGSGSTAVTLIRPSLLRHGAMVLTWWTILIEILIAITFLVPRLGRWRDEFLQVFLLTSYTLIPITGFGLILVALGVGQSQARGYAPRLGYLLALAVLIASLAW
jgi:hypothetical protein